MNLNPLEKDLLERLHRVLVVDDDPAIRLLLRQKLEDVGYEVWTAESGDDALAILEHRGLPHLAIVDLMMPGMTGFELCEAIQQFADLPIIILTAVDAEEVVIRGIQYFAEDYVTKPFSPRELAARVERILRRQGSYEYVFDAITRVDQYLSVDFLHQRAFVADAPVEMTPTETKILYILLRNAGQVVTPEFLLRRIWPLEQVFEDTLRVHIHRLRQKIEPDPRRPVYILTERGAGYKFRARPGAKRS